MESKKVVFSFQIYLAMLLTVVEIALLLLLPLVLFYQTKGVKLKVYFGNIAIIYLIWYLSYAPIHELMHWFGAWIFDKPVYDYRLIPPFWRGEFGVGYIKYDFIGDSRDFVILLLPYLKDLIFLPIGLFLLRKINSLSLLFTGLISTLFLFSSLFDIANNYFAYLLGNLNDFNGMRVSCNNFVSHSIGVSFFSASLFATIRLLWKEKKSLLKKNSKKD